MEREGQPEDGTARLTWYTAFVGAIQAELNEYKDALEFYPEYQVASEPLRIDCVVIKKAKDVISRKT